MNPCSVANSVLTNAVDARVSRLDQFWRVESPLFVNKSPRILLSLAHQAEVRDPGLELRHAHILISYNLSDKTLRIEYW